MLFLVYISIQFHVRIGGHDNIYAFEEHTSTCNILLKGKLAHIKHFLVGQSDVVSELDVSKEKLAFIII